MSPNNSKRRREKKKKLKASDVQGAKMLGPIIKLLKPLHEHCDDPKRKLHYDSFCVWLLLYFFTPILDSMRGLQQASDLPEIQKRLNLPRFSLGSFSEASHIFDPELLAPIIEELSGRLEDLETNPHLVNLDKRPVAVDGTLLHALPKMTWALWCDEEHRAAKLHLHLDLLTGLPERAEVTNGQASEVKSLMGKIQSGRLYITDRGYFCYSLMAAMLDAGSSFVGRVRNNAVYETIEEREITDAGRAENIVADRIVWAGCDGSHDKMDRPLRLIEIHVPDTGPSKRSRVDPKSKACRTQSTDHTILLLTDQFDLDAETIAVLFRYRWQVELFFRWFKKILNADKLLSLSEQGLTIVMYCALIASMLVALWTGRKPTKRTFELLCFYFYGLASDEDLIRHIEKLKVAEKNK
jgi:hypothetical protein